MEASSNCPICGFDRPHQHTGEQVARHRGAVDRGDPISFDSYGRAFRELVEGHLIPCPKPHDTISQICRRAAIIQSGVDAPVPTLSQPIEPQGAVVGVELPEWTTDCQGKQDMDGEIVHLSTRYYPGNYQDDGRPSTHATIYCGERVLAESEFNGATESEVKAATEAWARIEWAKVIAALSALPVAVGAGEWLPIESAPKDGTLILGAHQYQSGRSDLYDVKFNEHGEWVDDTGDSEIAPTHWQPLPAPPAMTPATPAGKGTDHG